MKLLNSVLITTILSVSTIGTSGKMRSFGECNHVSVGKLFTCLSGNDSDITQRSAIKNSKCYPGHGMNADILHSLFRCVDDNGDGKISAVEAIYGLCQCLA